MKFLAFIFLFISFNAFACWKIEGSLAIDGETYKFDQKFDHGKEYAFPMGTFIFKITIIPGKNKVHTVKYNLVEKKGIKLNLITQGDDEISEDSSKEIYSKGEPNQPHSIITLKFKTI